MGCDLMAQKPKYVREYKDRHGVTRLEFRRSGMKGWRLRQPLRSEGFWEDYEAAVAGKIPPGIRQKRENHHPQLKPSQQHSLGWLIAGYKSSAKFKSLAASTQNVRGSILDRLCEEFGEYPYATLSGQAVMKIRDRHSNKPEAANAIVKALRQVYRYALEYCIAGSGAWLHRS